MALPLAGAASSPQLVGSEIQVNTNNLAELHNPAAAFDGAGHTMVVWENDLLGVRGRLYDGAGNALGSELSLVANASWSVLPGIAPVTFHRDPAIVFLPSGNFLLAWAEEQGNLEWTIYFENLQVFSREIVVQQFDVTGRPLGSPVTISSGGAGLKSRPRLAVRSTGDVVAAWMSGYGPATTPAGELGVFTRLLSSKGQPEGSQTKVDTVSGAVGSTPALALDPDGSFLIAWSSQKGNDTFNTSIYGRVFGPSGAPLAAPFAVSANTTGPQGRPTAANDRQGSYLVAWQGYFNDVWHSRIYGQIVSNAGGLLGKLQTISNGAGKSWAEVAPSAALAPGGTFTLVWMEYNTWFPVGLAGMQTDRSGAPLGSLVWINNQQIGSQFRTSLATDGAGHYLSPYEGFQDQSTIGILARYFSAN
ncbi:MAG TPA: hypothetical protein VMW75_17640 [Thermoanaerobaculia bacterium]|nr:hypothetical protein [Thermoanaerobaculia bacterium]